MTRFDIHKAIIENNRREKTYFLSFEIAMRAIEGEEIKILCPDEETTKAFINEVKNRIDEIEAVTKVRG